MKAETMISSGQGIVSIILALVAALFVFGVLTNRNVPLVSSTRGALIALVVLGFVMCTAGGLSNKVGQAGFFWFSPFVILGFVLGLTRTLQKPHLNRSQRKPALKTPNHIQDGGFD